MLYVMEFFTIQVILLRVIFNISSDRFKFLDPRLREQEVGKVRKFTWFADQYKNPHESKHTIGEILKWFEKTGFDFVYGIPNPQAFKSFELDDPIFKIHPCGNWFDHFFVQSLSMIRGSKEGGFFTMIGKKQI